MIVSQPYRSLYLDCSLYSFSKAYTNEKEMRCLQSVYYTLMDEIRKKKKDQKAYERLHKEMVTYSKRLKNYGFK